MSNAAKLKRKAIEFEQKKMLDKAVSFYVQFLEESGTAIDDDDVQLYNRVGDLMLRLGNSSDALDHFERAVDLYAERGFHNNAIALCNKVLRQSPGRASIYYRLGKISATKGFKSDAKKNFLEYADRMQKVGQIDEAFRALKEFADLCPDQDDIRLLLAEQLSKENRQDEALEQLQKLHNKLDSEGRTAEARATAERMKAIDPDVVPQSSGSYPPQKSSDLVFLDTSFEQPSRARKPAAPPPRRVTDPDLVAPTLRVPPAEPLTPLHNAAGSAAFGLDLDTSEFEAEAPAPPTNDLPLIDISDALSALPHANGAAAAPGKGGPADVDGLTFILPSDAGQPVLESPNTDMRGVQPPADTRAADREADRERAPKAAPADQPRYVAGPPLGVDYAGDLAADVLVPSEVPGSDLFDFRSPPRADEDTLDSPPPGLLDPDVSFPSLDLDTSLPSADEITSGASLAAALGAVTLGSDVESVERASDGAQAPPTVARVTGESLAIQPGGPEALLETLELSTETAGESSGPDLGDAVPLVGLMTNSLAPADESTAGGEVGGVDARAEEAAPASWLQRNGDALPPHADTSSRDDDAPRRALERAAASARLDAFELGDAPVLVPVQTTIPTPVRAPTPARLPTPAPTAPHVVKAEPPDPPPPPAPPTWESRRAHAERLLEAGNRAGGLRELEQMAADLERSSDLEGALAITDELIRLAPDSVRHHQKRVELAFRAGDRMKLIDAYIELGDALFRSGEEPKARAVYQRVLELAPDDPRARAALESVASTSPPAGSTAVTPPRPARVATAPPRLERAAMPAPPPSNGTLRRGSAESTSTHSRRPAPLDRSAAMNGDFVDLSDWLQADRQPRSTRMVTEEKPPTGDEQADFHEMLKRFKQGIADNVDEEDYESHYDLGVAYKEMGLLDEAVAEFQKALRGSAHRVRAYEALGQCFMEKEQYPVASSVLSRAIALGAGDDHHLVGVLYLMGRATEALSRYRDALDYYQRVFAVDIEFRDVAERISALERKAN